MVHLWSRCRSEPVSTRRIDFGVRQQVQREFSGDAAVEQLIFRLPRFFHRLLIDFKRARISRISMGVM